MDHSDAAASPVKSTGIPRFSRLPTLKPSGIPAAPHSAGPDAKSFLPSPAKAPSTRPSPVKPSIPQPKSYSKRSSLAGPPSHLPPPRTLTHRATQSVHASDVKTALQGKRPESRSSSRLARPAPRQHHSSRTEDSEDQLGSLDGFRTASRQSSRAGSPPPEWSDGSILPEQATPKARKPSRPSLSDRTIESISRLPPTPATERRRSGFFPPQSPMGPPSRPASALSMTMRPGSSDGSLVRPRAISPAKPVPASARPSNRISVDYSAAKSTPSKRSISAAPPRTAQPLSRSVQSTSIARPGSSGLSKIGTGSRLPGAPATVTSRVPASQSGFGASQMKKKAPAAATVAVRKGTESPDLDSQPSTKPSTSSAALRDQIAKAKAAKRAVASSKGLPQVDGSSEFEFDLSSDPFNAKPKDNNGLLLKRIDAARADGRLNISGMGLKAIPGEVLHMYDAEEMAKSKISWNETVDLTRLVAAGNEFQTISDEVFPDLDFDDNTLSDDDDPAKGFQFRGLEALDMHGNILTTIPAGLRRLERLTVVNLSHNKLSNAVCEILGQIESLKELHLGHNNLTGYMSQNLNQLRNLHTLDLQSNKLLSLPEGVRELVNLRVLNVSSNQLTGLPMEALTDLPLTDLDVSNNAMVGALFSFSVSGLSRLQYLNVSNNSLASLAFSEAVSLPALKSINIANNRIVSLPDMTGWTELVTLAAADNKISVVPSGFSTLKNVKHADFTSNDLVKLHDEIGLMESLESFKIDANPIRERKLLTLTTDELKRNLRTRLNSDVDHSREDYFEDEGIDIQSPGNVQLWKLNSGVLDLADKELVDEDSDELRSFLSVNHEVRELVLAKNSFSMIPFEISLAQNLRVLDISNCSLGGDYITEMVNFQVLRELNMSGNKASSWDPLLEMFNAPCLTTLDVSNNRLIGSLPVLRLAYPDLKELHARDNRIDAVSAEALEGLHTVDVGNNNIGYLPPEIGLLWDHGLKGLSVNGNAFRVPNYRVLEKGTEATLAWLREKIPEE